MALPARPGLGARGRDAGSASSPVPARLGDELAAGRREGRHRAGVDGPQGSVYHGALSAHRPDERNARGICGLGAGGADRRAGAARGGRGGGVAVVADWMRHEFLCPECNAWSPESWAWSNDADGPRAACEDCGDHPAAECPDCHAVIDLIWNTLKRRDVYANWGG